MCGVFLSTIKSMLLLAKVSRKPFSIIESELPITVDEDLRWNIKHAGFSSDFSLKLICDAICSEGVQNDSISFFKNSPARKIYVLNSKSSSVIVKSFSFKDS